MAGVERTASRTRSRVAGVDAARGLALIGIVIAHAAPDTADPVAAFWQSVPDERSRLLFALTAGLSLGLLTGGTRPVGRGDTGPASREIQRRQLTIRALCLLVLGLLLTATGVLVREILDEYGVAFLNMVPLVFLQRK